MNNNWMDCVAIENIIRAIAYKLQRDFEVSRPKISLYSLSDNTLSLLWKDLYGSNPLTEQIYPLHIFFSSKDRN